jgi:hypothetical protein
LPGAEQQSLIGGEIPDDSRGHAAAKDHRRNILSYDSPGGDNRAATHGDAWRNDRPCSNPDFILDPDRFEKGAPAPTWLVNQAMAGCLKHYPWTHLHSATDTYLRRRTKTNIRIEKAALANTDIAGCAQRPDRQRPPNFALAVDAQASQTQQTKADSVTKLEPWQVVRQAQEN